MEKDKREVAIRISGVRKAYRLGQITAKTLQGDIKERIERSRERMRQRKEAGSAGKTAEDVKTAGADRFYALDGIDLTIYKGEALGIIGKNGAGKSTLLKLLSRITAPTEGEIEIHGRVTSMLEVGTGFHSEMTGRENIYLNGAILGMSRAETEAKMDDIISFSEVRDFIDTPVKRYSSGMYVKLGFSVAAHLDSEIMIMDEVLAVGDMAFQKKCLEKMSDVSKTEGRTILYVSHNMNTIRQLCDRVIVLDHGRVVFDGEEEKGIGVYMGRGLRNDPVNDWIMISSERHDDWTKTFAIEQVRINNRIGVLNRGEDFVFSIAISKKENLNRKIHLRAVIKDEKNDPITMMYSDEIVVARDISFYTVFLRTVLFAPARYSINLALYELGDNEVFKNLDVIRDILSFTIVEKEKPAYGMLWNTHYWGHTISDKMLIKEDWSGV